MSCVRSLWIFLTLILFEFNSVQSRQCDWNDEECLTNAASRIYNVISTGKYGQLDPLHIIERFEGDIGPIRYVVTNATLFGLRDCKVQSLKHLPPEHSTFEHRLHCPKIHFDFHFDVKGTIDGEDIEGTGLGSETTEDYLIINRGESDVYNSETDQKPRLLLKNYKLEFILRGKFTFEIKKLFKGNKSKLDLSVAYFNTLANQNKKLVQSRVIEYAMNLYMDTVNAYLRDIPLQEAISYDY